MSCCKPCSEARKANALSFDLEHLNALQKVVDEDDNIKAALSSSTPVTRRLHVTKSGNVIAKAGAVVGGTGYVVSAGNIGALPYRATHKFSLNDTTLSASFSLEKPVRLPEYTFQFEATGVVRDQAGKITRVSGFRPSENTQHTDTSEWGIFLCTLACGGEAVADACLECIEDVVDPPAFIACVAAIVALDPETEECIEGCLEE